MKPLFCLSLALAAAVLAVVLLLPPRDASVTGTTADTAAGPKTEHKLDLDVTEDGSTIQLWTGNFSPGFQICKKDA